MRGSYFVKAREGEVVSHITYIRLGGGLCRNLRRACTVTETSPCVGVCTGTSDTCTRVARLRLELLGQEAVRARAVG